MNWTPKTKPGKALALAAFIGTSIAGTYGGYQALKAMGMPTPAWVSDIKKLDRQQAETAIEVYRNKVKGLRRDKPLYVTPDQLLIWEEAYGEAKRQLERAEQHRIELSR